MARKEKASTSLRAMIDMAIHSESKELRAELVLGLKSEGLLDSMVFADHTPLTFACQAGLVESVKMLLRAGADPKINNEWGQCPLMWACDADAKLPIAIALMDAGADVEQANQVKDRPLHTAAFGGDMEIIKALIARGADIDAPGQDGWAPVHIACKMGNVELVKLLADRGADLERRAEKQKKMSDPMGIAMEYSFISPQLHLECIGYIARLLAAREEAKILTSATKKVRPPKDKGEKKGKEQKGKEQKGKEQKQSEVSDLATRAKSKGIRI